MGKKLNFISGDGMALSGTVDTETAKRKLTIGLADGGVTADKLADGGVTADKLADGAISADKLPADLAFYRIGMVYPDIVLRSGFALAYGGILTNVSANYARLKAWLLSDEGSPLVVTQAEYDELASDEKWEMADGTSAPVVYRFVLDAPADTVRLPVLAGAYMEFAGADGLEAAGAHADAIRNILGSLKIYYGGAISMGWYNAGAYTKDSALFSATDTSSIPAVLLPHQTRGQDQCALQFRGEEEEQCF
jgi:hypothetical protein